MGCRRALSLDLDCVLPRLMPSYSTIDKHYAWVDNRYITTAHNIEKDEQEMLRGTEKTEAEPIQCDLYVLGSSLHIHVLGDCLS